MPVGFLAGKKRSRAEYEGGVPDDDNDVSSVFGPVFDKMCLSFERERSQVLAAAAPAQPLGFVTDPERGQLVRQANRPSGRERLALMQRTLDSFGLVRSKNQRWFHRQMTQAVIRKLFQDDLAENLDALREEFGVDKFKSEVMIVTPRRWGKCIGPDELVLLANGGTRRAADVQVGDLLVGDDGKARVVMNTCTGRAPMFRVGEAAASPSDDAAFVCNDAHLLVFEMRGPRARVRRRDASIEVVERYFDADGLLRTHERVYTYRLGAEAEAEARVRELNACGRPTITLQAADVYKQLVEKGGPVTHDGSFILPSDFATPRRRVDEFPSETNLAILLKEIDIDPLDAAYYAGIWLGDGTSVRSNEITADIISSKEIIEFAEGLAAKCGLHAHRRVDNRRPNVVALHLSTTDQIGVKRRRPNVARCNPVQQALIVLGLDATKRISATLMGASRAARLQLLAGLLDTDGHYEAKTNRYEIVQVRQYLANDCARLARSLGMAATVHERTINGKSYWRVRISGDLHDIPCRLPRKRAPFRTLGRDYERVTTAISALGDGEYYGFQCAAIASGAPGMPQKVSEALVETNLIAGAAGVEGVAAYLVSLGIIIPSEANGAASADGRCYPGRFLLANHTVVHNTYSVAMFVVSCAMAIEGSVQAIFSTGRRASEALLKLVVSFLCKIPGVRESIVRKTVETVWIQGPGGPDDIRKISSYPSKASTKNPPCQLPLCPHPVIPALAYARCMIKVAGVHGAFVPCHGR